MAQKVCLIDGSGYIFRAFYGLPPLTAPDGTPVNAVYGFVNMFLKLTKMIDCDYCLVLFDAKRQNFRNEIFENYKGNRAEIPEDLIPQFEIIHEAVKALNINFLSMEGYEADDLIATYAKKAKDAGLDTVVVSGDKDLMQLVEDKIEFYDPMKDKFFGPEEVKEKFGVYPNRVTDVQALAGDKIDNVPGVEGIGIKTAALLINEFGSLDEVLNRAGEIKQNKRREMLIEHAEDARISLKLVTLKKDVPVELELADFHCHNPEAAILEEFVNKYGFNSLKPRLQKWFQERKIQIQHLDKPEIVKAEYKAIKKEAELSDLIKEIKASQMMSIEAIEDNDDMIGIAIAPEKGKAYLLEFDKAENNEQAFDLFSVQATKEALSKKEFDKYLRPLLEAKSILKIGNNIKETMHILDKNFKDIEFFPYDDTAVISYSLDSTQHNHDIKSLCNMLLEESLLTQEDLTGKGKDKIALRLVDKEKLLDFAGKTADYNLRIYQELKKRLIEEKRTTIYENFDRPLVATLFKMEKRGVKVDKNALCNLSFYFDEKLNNWQKEIYEEAGEEFNVASPKQVGEILFDKKGFKGKKTPTGAWQTGADILEELADTGVKLAEKILNWRELSKLKSTYSDALINLTDKENRIHTTYSQIVANTGRLASSNPNLQNIPIRSEEGKKIRSCFIAKAGYKLVSCDYSQVELRLLADVADVKKLKEAFRQGIDVHKATACHVFGLKAEEIDANLRRQAKAINFGIVYGISQYGLAKNIGTDVMTAKNYIDTYFEQMPEIKAYMEKTIEFAHKYGYVETPFGRRCPVLGINDKNKRIVANAERAAINAPIQGGAADIIKLAMNKIEYILTQKQMKTKMLLQVHDELIFEVPENEVDEALKIIKENMEGIVNTSVILEAQAGVGNNWTEAH